MSMPQYPTGEHHPYNGPLVISPDQRGDARRSNEQMGLGTRPQDFPSYPSHSQPHASSAHRQHQINLNRQQDQNHNFKYLRERDAGMSSTSHMQVQPAVAHYPQLQHQSQPQQPQYPTSQSSSRNVHNNPQSWGMNQFPQQQQQQQQQAQLQDNTQFLATYDASIYQEVQGHAVGYNTDATTAVQYNSQMDFGMDFNTVLPTSVQSSYNNTQQQQQSCQMYPNQTSTRGPVYDPCGTYQKSVDAAALAAAKSGNHVVTYPDANSMSCVGPGDYSVTYPTQSAAGLQSSMSSVTADGMHMSYPTQEANCNQFPVQQQQAAYSTQSNSSQAVPYNGRSSQRTTSFNSQTDQYAYIPQQQNLPYTKSYPGGNDQSTAADAVYYDPTATTRRQPKKSTNRQRTQRQRTESQNYRMPQNHQQTYPGKPQQLLHQQAQLQSVSLDGVQFGQALAADNSMQIMQSQQSLPTSDNVYQVQSTTHNYEMQRQTQMQQQSLQQTQPIQQQFVLQQGIIPGGGEVGDTIEEDDDPHKTLVTPDFPYTEKVRPSFSQAFQCANVDQLCATQQLGSQESMRAKEAELRLEQETIRREEAKLREEAELFRLKEEEKAREQAEQARLKELERVRLDEQRRRQEERDALLRRQHAEEMRIKQYEEERRRKLHEEEQLRQQELLRKQKEAEMLRLQQEKEQRQRQLAEEQRRRNEEEQRRRHEEEQRRRHEEEQRRRHEEEQRRRHEEEQLRRQEMLRRQKEEEMLRLQQEEQQRQRQLAEEQRRLQLEEEERQRKLEEERRLRRQEQERLRKQKEEELLQKQRVEEQRKKEEEDRLKREHEEQLRKEREAEKEKRLQKEREEAEAKLREEEEKQRRKEEKRKKREEKERLMRAEEQKRLQKEKEERLKEQRRKEHEEEERKKKEKARKRREADDRKRKEAEEQKKKQKEEEERKRKQEEQKRRSTEMAKPEEPPPKKLRLINMFEMPGAVPIPKLIPKKVVLKKPPAAHAKLALEKQKEMKQQETLAKQNRMHDSSASGSAEKGQKKTRKRDSFKALEKQKEWEMTHKSREEDKRMAEQRRMKEAQPKQQRVQPVAKQQRLQPVEKQQRLQPVEKQQRLNNSEIERRRPAIFENKRRDQVDVMKGKKKPNEPFRAAPLTKRKSLEESRKAPPAPQPPRGPPPPPKAPEPVQQQSRTIIELSELFGPSPSELTLEKRKAAEMARKQAAQNQKAAAATQKVAPPAQTTMKAGTSTKAPSQLPKSSSATLKPPSTTLKISPAKLKPSPAKIKVSPGHLKIQSQKSPAPSKKISASKKKGALSSLRSPPSKKNLKRAVDKKGDKKNARSPELKKNKKKDSKNEVVKKKRKIESSPEPDEEPVPVKRVLRSRLPRDRLFDSPVRDDPRPVQFMPNPLFANRDLYSCGSDDDSPRREEVPDPPKPSTLTEKNVEKETMAQKKSKKEPLAEKNSKKEPMAAKKPTKKVDMNAKEQIKPVAEVAVQPEEEQIAPMADDELYQFAEEDAKDLNLEDLIPSIAGMDDLTEDAFAILSKDVDAKSLRKILKKGLDDHGDVSDTEGNAVNGINESNFIDIAFLFNRFEDDDEQELIQYCEFSEGVEFNPDDAEIVAPPAHMPDHDLSNEEKKANFERHLASLVRPAMMFESIADWSNFTQITDIADQLDDFLCRMLESNCFTRCMPVVGFINVLRMCRQLQMRKMGDVPECDAQAQLQRSAEYFRMQRTLHSVLVSIYAANLGSDSKATNEQRQLIRKHALKMAPQWHGYNSDELIHIATDMFMSYIPPAGVQLPLNQEESRGLVLQILHSLVSMPASYDNVVNFMRHNPRLHHNLSPDEQMVMRFLPNNPLSLEFLTERTYTAVMKCSVLEDCDFVVNEMFMFGKVPVQWPIAAYSAPADVQSTPAAENPKIVPEPAVECTEPQHVLSEYFDPTNELNYMVPVSDDESDAEDDLLPPPPKAPVVSDEGSEIIIAKETEVQSCATVLNKTTICMSFTIPAAPARLHQGKPIPRIVVPCDDSEEEEEEVKVAVEEVEDVSDSDSDDSDDETSDSSEESTSSSSSSSQHSPEHSTTVPLNTVPPLIVSRASLTYPTAGKKLPPAPPTPSSGSDSDSECEESEESESEAEPESDSESSYSADSSDNEESAYEPTETAKLAVSPHIQFEIVSNPLVTTVPKSPLKLIIKKSVLQRPAPTIVCIKQPSPSPDRSRIQTPDFPPSSAICWKSSNDSTEPTQPLPDKNFDFAPSPLVVQINPPCQPDSESSEPESLSISSTESVSDIDEPLSPEGTPRPSPELSSPQLSPEYSAPSSPLLSPSEIALSPDYSAPASPVLSPSELALSPLYSAPASPELSPSELAYSPRHSAPASPELSPSEIALSPLYSAPASPELSPSETAFSPEYSPPASPELSPWEWEFSPRYSPPASPELSPSECAFSPQYSPPASPELCAWDLALSPENTPPASPLLSPRSTSPEPFVWKETECTADFDLSRSQPDGDTSVAIPISDSAKCSKFCLLPEQNVTVLVRITKQPQAAKLVVAVPIRHYTYDGRLILKDEPVPNIYDKLPLKRPNICIVTPFERACQIKVTKLSYKVRMAVMHYGDDPEKRRYGAAKQRRQNLKPRFQKYYEERLSHDPSKVHIY